MNKEIYDFKSCADFFKFEKEDCKNNTVRKIDIKDERFHGLLKAWKSEDYPLIRINHAEYCQLDRDKAKSIDKDEMNSFIRQIKHIAVYGDLMIISWKSVNVERQNE